MSAAFEAALAYAAHGRHVLPVGRHKKPITEHGLLNATTDPDVIRRWFGRPGVMLAIRTGQVSDLVALDVDGDEGADSLHKLELEHGAAAHLLVQDALGRRALLVPLARCAGQDQSGEIAPGLDMRGDGGYAIVPPSVDYELDCTAPLPPMPDWLVRASTAGPDQGGEAGTPEQWVRLLINGIRSGRNPALAKLTGLLLRRYVPVDVAALLVHAVNETYCKPPKPRAEVNYIVDSIAGRELRRRERRAR